MTLPKYVAPKPRALMNFFWPTSWMVSDPERFNALIKEAASLCEGGIHFADNLFTWARNNSLFDDVAFREAWERNVVNDADRAVAWRRYFLATMAYHAVQLPGDFVECGVYAGTGVKTVMDYLGGTAFPKPFWAYDTYDYNPVEGHAFDGQRPGFFEEVTKRFEGYANVRLVKGFIPESFAGACPEAIAYLHIDLNNAQAEIVPKYDNGRISAHGVACRISHSDVLARAVGLDIVAAGWRPTVEGYFRSVTKPRILADVAEARGPQFAEMIDHLKKADMAREAERLLDDAAWLPEPMRTPGLDDAELVDAEGDAADGELPAFLTEDAAEPDNANDAELPVAAE